MDTKLKVNINERKVQKHLRVIHDEFSELHGLAEQVSDKPVREIYSVLGDAASALENVEFLFDSRW